MTANTHGISGARRGFSLVQLSIIITIMALLAAAVLPGGNEASTVEKQDVTLKRMITIEQAIRGWRASYRNGTTGTQGRLPCPARGDLAINDANFGIEGDCTANTGVTVASTNIIIGVPPVRTLGLGEEYMYDGFGRRLTYVVDLRATQSGRTLITDDNGAPPDVVSVNSANPAILRIKSTAHGLAVGANIVNNGSFEAGASCQQPAPAGSRPASWDYTGGTGVDWMNNGCGGDTTESSPAGGYYLELDGTGNQNTGVRQNIATTPGQLYMLQFAYRPRSAAALATNSMDVLWNGQLTRTYRNAAAAWADYTVFVRASAANTDLEFRPVGTADSTGALLDNVRLQAVPEVMLFNLADSTPTAPQVTISRFITNRIWHMVTNIPTANNFDLRLSMPTIIYGTHNWSNVNTLAGQPRLERVTYDPAGGNCPSLQYNTDNNLALAANQSALTLTRKGVFTGESTTSKPLMLLISHGSNGHGAFLARGSTIANRTNSGSGDVDERLNAYVDGAFAVTTTGNFVQKPPTATFDDIVRAGYTCY